MATHKTAKRVGSGRKYSRGASANIEREMSSMKEGKLRSGSGRKVTDPKQAVAIGLSEARKSGEKVPSASKRSNSPRRAATKSASHRSATGKVASTRKTTAKSSPHTTRTKRSVSRRKHTAK
jgi:Family of unknown function (DUF6496)